MKDVRSQQSGPASVFRFLSPWLVMMSLAVSSPGAAAAASTEQATTRAQMTVFLVRTFNLP